MSDYLWDKSGEVDSEIEQLEELLGTLSHRPRAAALPDSLLSQLRPRAFAHWSELAAAAVLILMGFTGLWISLQRLDARAEISALASQDVSIAPVEPGNISRTTLGAAHEVKHHSRSNAELSYGRNIRRRPPFYEAANRKGIHTPVQTSNTRPVNEAASVQPQMSAEELAEARRARDELILALQVASAKLNHAQRRAQSLNSTNPGLNP